MADDKKKKPEEKKKPVEAPAEAPPEEPVEEAETEEVEDPGVEGEPEVPAEAPDKVGKEKPGEGEEVADGEDVAPSNQEVADLISSLAEHNIHLDAEKIKTHKDLCEHLTIALKALKGVLQPGQAGGAAGDPNQGVVEEQPSSTLSHDEDPKVTALQAKLAESELKHVISKIDNLVANGQVKGHKAKSWVATLTEHQLGLVDDEPETKLAVIKGQIDFAASEIPVGTLFGMTAKELEEKFGKGVNTQLSADEVDPVDTQKWGGNNTLDPEKIKEIAAKFLKETRVAE